MFGIGGTELFIIVVFVLLIFGPDKLPQFGRTIGQMMREFKRAQETMESVIRAEVYADKRTPGNLADVESDEEGEDEEAVPPTRVPGTPLLADDSVPEDEDEEEEE
ncbi:MAG: twin-arginine translocase TatA/TatE family subunit [Anaerosomatales bacterium]|nr:twin-arginine translocase TatA/TatE family subunit [Anaerosomatales bacterium]MDT8434816.1 twin-arginine translocase TatA/TatE family subunit [Anaerosomatales bacterium]